MGFFSEWHHTYKHRKWRKAVKKACFNRCDISGETKNLEAHHLFDVKSRPELALLIDNGVMLTRELHKEFHCDFMGGYHINCTLKDYLKFKKSK